jgi:hypothetical protein
MGNAKTPLKKETHAKVQTQGKGATVTSVEEKANKRADHFYVLHV